MITFKQFLLEAAEPSRIDLLSKAIEQALSAAGATDAKSIHKKTNGTIRHVRLKSDDIDPLFAKIGVKLTYLPGDKRATGKIANKTYTGTLTRAFGDFAKGETFIVVNTHSEGSKISNKLLTPSKLGLETGDGNFLTAGSVVSKTKTALKDLDAFSEEELAYFSKLLTLGTAESHTVKAPPSLSADDLNRIAIDFGEVFGAVWYSKQLKMNKIRFPTGNNALVDFILSAGDIEKQVSSKAGKGAPPSLGVVVDQIKLDKKYFEKKYSKEVVAAVLLIQDSSAIEGALAAHKVLKTPGYAMLSKVTGITDFTKDATEAYLKKFKTPAELMTKLKPVFDFIGHQPSQESLDIIFKENAIRVGIISAQMANYLVKLFNTDPTYKKFHSILNDAVSSIRVDQLYTNLSSTKIEFKLKPFETSKFKWINNSSTRKANLSRMGFTMLH